MCKYALITGGASGLGLELSKLFAKDGIDLFLVSSNIANLNKAKEDLEKEYNIHVEILALDLTNPQNFHKVKEYSDEHKLDVHYLVNNAGYGDQADLVDMDTDKQVKMIDLNCNAPLALMCDYIKDFKKADEDRYILNISSIAAFYPGPHMCTYHASKAFLLNMNALMKSMA